MRIAVMGAGAVGGYFGARLAASGQDVAFIARGEHLEAMRKEGLKIKSFQGDFLIRSLFTSKPQEVGVVDLILFCVKSYSTEEAIRASAPLVGDKTIIVSLQNGVDNPDKIAELWGRDRTLAGVVYIASEVSAPGIIEHSAGGRLIIGELDGGVSEGTKSVQQLFSLAQVPCTISPEIRKVMWGKLVWNAPFCAIACLARATAQQIVETEALKKLAVDCMEEVIEAARCQEVYLEKAVVTDALKLSEGLGNFRPSMLQDLEAGKPLEHDAFNGIVVKLMRQAGKNAPINEAFYSLLDFMDKKIRHGEGN